MKYLLHQLQLNNHRFCYRGPEDNEAPAQAQAPKPSASPEAAVEAGVKGVAGAKDSAERKGIPATNAIANRLSKEGLVAGDPNKKVKEAVTNPAETENKSETIKAPLSATDAEAVFSQIDQVNPELVIPSNIKAEVQAGLESDPIDTEALSEAELQQEIQNRVIRAKIAASSERMIITEGDEANAESEADYLNGLAEKYDLDPTTLALARARNQVGIGSEVDQTDEIKDPIAYKESLDAFAQNLKKTQEYLDSQGDLATNNPAIQAKAMAILRGEDPENMSEAAMATAALDLSRDQNLGEAFSSIGRMASGNRSSLGSIGSGLGSIDLDPANLDAAPPLDLKKYEPGSAEAQQLFAQAAEKIGAPKEWGASSGLHSILRKESKGMVGVLNYTFRPVAKRMGTEIDDPKFVSFVHEKLKAGATAGNFGIRSTATGLGQLLKANVEAYYPSQQAGIGNPEEEAAGMLAYIKGRYTTPDNAAAQYGTKFEGY